MEEIKEICGYLDSRGIFHENKRDAVSASAYNRLRDLKKSFMDKYAEWIGTCIGHYDYSINKYNCDVIKTDNGYFKIDYREIQRFEQLLELLIKYPNSTLEFLKIASTIVEENDLKPDRFSWFKDIKGKFK